MKSLDELKQCFITYTKEVGLDTEIDPKYDQLFLDKGVQSRWMLYRTGYYDGCKDMADDYFEQEIKRSKV